jgi:hypothetical protein
MPTLVPDRIGSYEKILRRVEVGSLRPDDITGNHLRTLILPNARPSFRLIAARYPCKASFRDVLLMEGFLIDFGRMLDRNHEYNNWQRSFEASVLAFPIEMFGLLAYETT